MCQQGTWPRSSPGQRRPGGLTLTAAARLRLPAALPAAFELLSRLPKHGLGSKLSRPSWTDDCFWTVTKVRLSAVRAASSAFGLEAHCANQPAALCSCVCPPIPCTPAHHFPLRSPPSPVQDGKHGSAWGTLTWRGQPQPPASPTALSGPLKPVWRVVADSSSSSSSSGEQWQSMLAATLRQERQTAAAEAAEGAAAGEEPAAGAAEQAASA